MVCLSIRSELACAPPMQGCHISLDDYPTLQHVVGHLTLTVMTQVEKISLELLSIVDHDDGFHKMLDISILAVVVTSTCVKLVKAAQDRSSSV